MSSTMVMERTGVATPGVGYPSYGSPTPTPTGVSVGTSWVMVPRCTYQFEKCPGGMKITCSCDDKMACSMMQNLCTMLAGGMCSCTCAWNGTTVYNCNLTMGMCHWEMTPDGCCLTCTSGDAKCCAMIQACCDCLCCMVEAGCTCCVCVNGTPVCCGCCDTKTPTKTKR